MGTYYYNLPKVNDEESTFSFIDSLNGLANAADATMESVREGFVKSPYELPAATTEGLGGVRVGKGFKYYADGLLDTAADRFKLTPATAGAIGGVVPGRNIGLTEDGAINLGEGAINYEQVDSAQFANGAVTGSKIAKSALDSTKLNQDMYNQLLAPAAIWKNAPTSTVNCGIGRMRFVFKRITDSIAMAIPIQMYNNGTGDTGKSGSLTYSNGSEVAAGALGSGTFFLAASQLGAATSGTWTESKTNVLMVDLDNSTSTLIQNQFQYVDARDIVYPAFISTI